MLWGCALGHVGTSAVAQLGANRFTAEPCSGGDVRLLHPYADPLGGQLRCNSPGQPAMEGGPISVRTLSARSTTRRSDPWGVDVVELLVIIPNGVLVGAGVSTESE